MSDPNFLILYVDNPTASVTFYKNLLGRPPVEASETFAMFALASGVMLGLWSKHAVEPPAAAAGGGAEIAFSVDTDKTVDAIADDWKSDGIAILQPPVRMDFGYTFVAQDPDGHRLRVFAESAPAK
ncbi:VOC family protein [Telmatospirillum sp.]|uniref:VOC family protein n=1 Tax=Telmatospirillum sp. TaxID=2079197 RepID=UPI00284D1C42|nr:VOC family protein [Telmatospirillum sp.]MDR3437292.1 VOC family protein [Telmatospirillum sp.]